MSKSYLKEALEADTVMNGIQDGLNHYSRRFQSIINTTPVVDGVLLVATMKILALAMEQKMDEDEKRIMQHIINQAICVDMNIME